MDGEIAGKIYADVAQAYNVSVVQRGARLTEALTAANQICASIIAAGAAMSDNPEAYIAGMLQGLAERIEDVRAGRIPQLCRMVERDRRPH